jgi:hypothetical protein
LIKKKSNFEAVLAEEKKSLIAGCD